MACGTPVLARRVGALPEIMRDGIDGFFGDDVEHLAFLVDRVDTLDRDAIRASVIDRFSAKRMTDAYEELYERAVDDARRAARRHPWGRPGLGDPDPAPLPGLDADDVPLGEGWPNGEDRAASAPRLIRAADAGARHRPPECGPRDERVTAAIAASAPNSHR